jgi:alanine racemase
MRFSAPVTIVICIPAGTRIGSEQTSCLPKDTKMAIVSLGDADGIPIPLSSSREVLIYGKVYQILVRL